MITLDISISGMHCDHCVRAIEAALVGLAGISEASVQVGKAEVKFDDAVTGKHHLFSAIREAGAFEIRGFVAVDQPV